MSHLQLMLPADIWMQKGFDAKAAREGGVVRRGTRDVERIVRLARFPGELKRRGYHAVENSGQIAISCNNDRVQVLC